jgi:hypothetical protein
MSLMKTARTLGVAICVLLAAGWAGAGTMTVGQTRVYSNTPDGHFMIPNEITDHSPWHRCSIEDWGWSFDLSALAPTDATGIVSATLTIKAWGEDTLHDQFDDIYVNSVKVGSLGWDGVPLNWELTTFSLPASILDALRRDRTLAVFMDIDRLSKGHRVTLKYAQLIVVYQVPGSNREAVYDPQADPDTFPDPYLSPTGQPGYAPGTVTDDNSADTTPVSQVWRDTLVIQNYVQSLTSGQNQSFKFEVVSGTAAGLDTTDVTYSFPTPAQQASKIVSIVPDKKQGRTYEMTTDARPAADADVSLEVSLASSSGQPLTVSSANQLRFSFPAGTTNNFPGKTITIQQYDPLNPAVLYPIYDVLTLITENAGVLPLQTLSRTYASQQSYACFTLSFSRELTDFNGDGRTDFVDFALLARHWREGPIVAAGDVAEGMIVGIADAYLNAFDLRALCHSWLGADIEHWTPVPAKEGFESDDFTLLPWTSSPTTSWWITSDRVHSGSCSARPMPLSDGQHCDLSVTLACTDGQMSFYVRPSCEYYYDGLDFYIDGKLKGSWSGDMDWERASFSISAGTHIFKWTYRKDAYGSDGEDAVWIDDLQFPVAK